MPSPFMSIAALSPQPHLVGGVGENTAVYGMQNSATQLSRGRKPSLMTPAAESLRLCVNFRCGDKPDTRSRQAKEEK